MSLPSKEPLVESECYNQNSSTSKKWCHPFLFDFFSLLLLLAILSVLLGLLSFSNVYPFSKSASESAVKIAFIGNSMLFYNDQPRFFSNLAVNVVQDSCLRGFASISSIFSDGNGMENLFNTTPAMNEDGSFDIGAPDVASLLSERWDYVILNDYSQGPARNDSRIDAINAIQNNYAPLINKTKSIPVFMMTAAYRAPAKNSSDLGSFEEFTNLLYEGYHAYAAAMNEALGKEIAIIAPVGEAYYTIYLENSTYWEDLYYIDNYHPSIHGSFLQGCVLHWSIFGYAPPYYNFSLQYLWKNARRNYPPEDGVSLQFPSKENEEYLRDVAERVYKAHTWT